MSWMLWIVVAYLGFGVITTITSVGKPREPLTGGIAAGVTIATAILITLIVIAGHTA